MTPTPPIVITRTGRVRGEDNGSHLSFRAIPYAAPPVGPRRFRTSVPADPWDDIFDATAHGAIVPQVFEEMDDLLGSEPMPSSEENSLHLTVHSPSIDGAPKAVFVWIHGGSFTSGSSDWTIYDGAHFARDGVVFVGINYRLHALGFLDLTRVMPHPETDANLALGDAVLALEWVRDNISAFGGDPDRVTIAGESAGAGMVSGLIASPAARGLFHRAIPQSGINFRVQEPDQSDVIARNFLAEIGVQEGDWSALEAVPIERILDASERRTALLAGVPGGLHLAWNMHRNPLTLPESCFAEFESGRSTRFDLLIGTTADENKLRWLVEEPDGVADAIERVTAERLELLRETYVAENRGSEEWEIAEAIGNDQSYLVPSIWSAEEHSDHGGRAYMYLFTWRSPVRNGRIGSCHALENAFVFDRLNSPKFHGGSPPQLLADEMHSAWLRFAETGDPNGGGLPVWPLYSSALPRVMQFGKRISVLDNPRGAERDAWRGEPPTVFGVA